MPLTSSKFAVLQVESDSSPETLSEIVAKAASAVATEKKKRRRKKKSQTAAVKEAHALNQAAHDAIEKDRKEEDFDVLNGFNVPQADTEKESWHLVQEKKPAVVKPSQEITFDEFKENSHLHLPTAKPKTSKVVVGASTSLVDKDMIKNEVVRQALIEERTKTLSEGAVNANEDEFSLWRKRECSESQKSSVISKEVEQKDLIIEDLKKENTKLKAQVETLKQKQKDLSVLLADGQFKNKKELLKENLNLSKLKEELTTELLELHSQLEHERSRVHNLNLEVQRLKEHKHAQDDVVNKSHSKAKTSAK